MPFSKFMPVCLSVCLCICLAVRLCVYLFCLFVWVSLFSAYVFEGFCEYTMFPIAFFVVITEDTCIDKDRKLSLHVFSHVIGARVDISHAFLNVYVRACAVVPAHICVSGWFRLCKPSTQPSVTKGPPCSEANHLLPTASRILAPLSNNGPARQTHIHTRRMTTSASCSYQQAHTLAHTHTHTQT